MTTLQTTKRRGSDTRPASRRHYWPWLKVLLCLVALDVLLFRVGWFWQTDPDFGVELEGQNWHRLYTLARRFEIEPPRPDNALVLGTSVVNLGVSDSLINEA